MLVCTNCGTPVENAGHPCETCGHRGSILQAVYERRQRGEPTPFAPAPQPPPPVPATELPAAPASAVVLGDADRAWTPWLAVVVGLLGGPVAGTYLAAANLKRLVPQPGDAWLTTLWALALQLLCGLLGGLMARSYPIAAWLLCGLFWLALLVGLVVWQGGPVARRRREQPGNHTPGADAFGAFLVALVLGVAAAWLTLFIGDRLSGGAFSAVPRGWLKPLQP